MTLYAFSRENWARSDDEVRGLFGAAGAGHPQRDRGAPRGGRPDPAARSAEELPDDTRRSIGDALEPRPPTATRLLLNVAFNYAGRTELVDAVRRLDRERRPRPSRSTRTTISDALYTAGLPDPDLVIRTGGEQRLSNFLIWQSAYAEFYSTEVLWPDFGADAFDAALLEFARRDAPVRTLTTTTRRPAAGSALRQRAISALIFVPPLVDRPRARRLAGSSR